MYDRGEEKEDLLSLMLLLKWGLRGSEEEEEEDDGGAMVCPKIRVDKRLLNVCEGCG